MTENSRIAKEHRRLDTYMNVPLVDKNLYVRSLRNSDIPYDTRHSIFDKQNSKTNKPDIPPL